MIKLFIISLFVFSFGVHSQPKMISNVPQATLGAMSFLDQKQKILKNLNFHISNNISHKECISAASNQSDVSICMNKNSERYDEHWKKTNPESYQKVLKQRFTEPNKKIDIPSKQKILNGLNYSIPNVINHKQCVSAANNQSDLSICNKKLQERNDEHLKKTNPEFYQKLLKEREQKKINESNKKIETPPNPMPATNKNQISKTDKEKEQEALREAFKRIQEQSQIIPTK
jgi:hypothetical protein